MAHWAARFLGLGPGRMAHDVGPMSYGLVLCPMALSYVLWPCPMAEAILGIQEGCLNPDILIEPNSWLRVDTGCMGK